MNVEGWRYSVLESRESRGVSSRKTCCLCLLPCELHPSVTLPLVSLRMTALTQTMVFGYPIMALWHLITDRDYLKLICPFSPMLGDPSVANTYYSVQLLLLRVQRLLLSLHLPHQDSPNAANCDDIAKGVCRNTDGCSWFRRSCQKCSVISEAWVLCRILGDAIIGRVPQCHRGTFQRVIDVAQRSVLEHNLWEERERV